MRSTACLTALVLLVAAAPAAAQTAADSTAIRAAALDYVEGWYTADAARMERALHPDLVKRIVREGEAGSEIRELDAASLVESTGRGGGQDTPPEARVAEVEILDVFQNAATVRAEMAGWVDYMHLGKVDGEWKILNVLWALKPDA